MSGKKQPNFHGIAFSIEAMLAAMMLFAMLVFSASLASSVAKPFQVVDQLSVAASGIAEAGAKNGAWLSAPPPSANDSAARALVGMLPPSICGSAEIYSGTVSPDALLWSYSQANCTFADDYPREISVRPVVKRYNSSYMELWIVRVATRPSSGG